MPVFIVDIAPHVATDEPSPEGFLFGLQRILAAAALCDVVASAPFEGSLNAACPESSCT